MSLRRGLITKRRVQKNYFKTHKKPVDVVQAAVLGGRCSSSKTVTSCIKTEQLVQPTLTQVATSIPGVVIVSFTVKPLHPMNRRPVHKPNGLFELTLMKSPPNQSSISGRLCPWNRLLPQLLQQLQAETATGAFVPGQGMVPYKLHNAHFLLPIDGGGHKDEVWSQQSLDQGQRDCCCLVDYNQLCLGKLGSIPYSHVQVANFL